MLGRGLDEWSFLCKTWQARACQLQAQLLLLQERVAGRWRLGRFVAGDTTPVLGQASLGVQTAWAPWLLTWALSTCWFPLK